MIIKMDAQGIGIAAMQLGAGRATKEDPLDYQAGITLLKKSGDRVEAGEPVARMYACDKRRFSAAKERFLQAITVKEEPFTQKPLILKRIGGRD